VKAGGDYTATMHSRRVPLAILLATAALACRASGPAPAPARQLRATARRVVLLSIDGLAATRHRHLLAQRAYREPAGLAAFESWGWVVERAIPVDPTLTAVNHATIATGAPPALTGIVSNRFHLPGTPISQPASGFDAAWAAEPLWQAFRRQGRRVGTVGYPGCDGRSAGRRTDFGQVWAGEPLAPPANVTLTASEFGAHPGGAPPVSFAPVRRASLAMVFAAGQLPSLQLTLDAIDSADDGVAAYDALVVDTDGDAGNGVSATARVGEWFPVEIGAPHSDGGVRRVGAWCRLRELAPDLSRVGIYRGGFHATEAYPRAFRELLDREASFWPGAADDDALMRALDGEPGLSVEEYLEQARRFSRYSSACARAAVTNERFDLLLACQPIIDEAQHALTIADPRQPRYSEGLAATTARAVNETYLIADAAVADLAQAIDLTRDALVVVSDHGIAPIWEVVHANEVLRRAGLAESVERGGRAAIGDRSPMVAMASASCAHLYVNLVGREPTGVVPADRVDEVVRAAARAFSRLEAAGVPLVEEMLTRAELAAIGLDSPNAGDLVLFMAPGAAITGAIGGAEHEPAPYAGQHGFRNHHPDMHGIWLARGAAVPRGRRSQAPLTEVASFVSHLAGVQPPRDAVPWRR